MSDKHVFIYVARRYAPEQTMMLRPTRGADGLREVKLVGFYDGERLIAKDS